MVPTKWPKRSSREPTDSNLLEHSTNSTLEPNNLIKYLTQWNPVTWLIVAIIFILLETIRGKMKYPRAIHVLLTMIESHSLDEI